MRRSFGLRQGGMSVDPNLACIPELRIRSGPRDAEWLDRVQEELRALISYARRMKDAGSEWFEIAMAKDVVVTGTKWIGTCWIVFEMRKYSFEIELEVPVGYPFSPIEIKIPELDGKTPKMYRGGAICQDAHFKPLWAKMAPRFGIAHALCMGLAPWLAAEIPLLIEAGIVQYRHKNENENS